MAFEPQIIVTKNDIIENNKVNSIDCKNDVNFVVFKICQNISLLHMRLLHSMSTFWFLLSITFFSLFLKIRSSRNHARKTAYCYGVSAPEMQADSFTFRALWRCTHAIITRGFPWIVIFRKKREKRDKKAKSKQVDFDSTTSFTLNTLFSCWKGMKREISCTYLKVEQILFFN